MTKISISLVVLTHDEEMNLPHCLASVTRCGDIHVLDSGSTDKTVEMARAAGAKIHSHPFESFAQQRNWAIEHCGLQHDWILFLDADEEATPEFFQEILQKIKDASDSVSGFYCCAKTIVENRWLKHSDGFPKWQFRLLRRGHASFSDFGHGQKEDRILGELDYIREPYLHFPVRKGWEAWIEKHKQYADLEAADRLRGRVIWKDFFSPHDSLRRKALKSIVSYIPGWPVLRFCFDYFLRFGFLEGKEGFIFCVNMARYEFLIQVKMRIKKM